MEKDWIFVPGGITESMFRCSCCGSVSEVPFPFCPQCGEPLTDLGRKRASERNTAKTVKQLDAEFNDCLRQAEEWDALSR